LPPDEESEDETGEADRQSDDEAISVWDIKSDLSDISDRIYTLEMLLEYSDEKEYVLEKIKELKDLLNVLEQC
jgi:hypothetical protein